jgi:hypothetical protein
MPDFRVYYEAANAIAGGKQLYGTLFSLGSGYYKYSPFTALLFYPISLLQYYTACIVYFLVVSTATVCTSILLFYIFNTHVFSQSVKSPNFILSVAAFCISIHIIREIGLGNVNMLLLLLLSLSLLFIIQKRVLLAALLLALVIITKPFFILILIPIAMRKHFKTIFTTGIFLLLFTLFPALLFGIGKDIELHKQWLNTMLLHSDSFPSPNTIEALIRYNLSIMANFQYITIFLLFVLYVFFVGINIIHNNKEEKANSTSFIIEWFTLIALMPSMFKTDTEHFLLSLPIILFILIFLFSHRNTLLTILFTILILLYDGNSSDLLGKTLSLEAYNVGILGISNVLLVILALFIYFIYIRKKNSVPT